MTLGAAWAIGDTRAVTDSPAHRRPTPDQVPAWVAYSGVGVVGLTALAVLAYYQHLFGVAAQMPWLLSWGFSIGLDWGSAVAGIFWFFGAAAVRSWGRASAIVLLLGSTALTCIAWGLASGWVWAPVGTIHPLVAFLMAKLLTVWRAHRAHAVAEEATMPALVAELRGRVETLRVAAERAAAEHAAELDALRASHTAQLAENQAALDAARGRVDELTCALHDTQEDLRVARRRRDQHTPKPGVATPPRPAGEGGEGWRAYLETAVEYLVAHPKAGRRMLVKPVTEDGAGIPTRAVTDHYLKTFLFPEAQRLAAERTARPSLAPVADTDAGTAEDAA